EAQATQAAGVVKGFAAAFGLTDVVKNVGEAAKRASDTAARCPQDGTLAAPGTKFCPECGTAMVQPASAKCAKCGANTMGAKFCPECGAPVAAAPTKCGKCGADLKGAKFCPECGTKAG
ncbi:MAG: zinc ribbon domain-containing protein, partial [Chloroflexota bacterium]|nr:zinc ribbon domain-containing protein [Chloroflexota bacterium]